MQNKTIHIFWKTWSQCRNQINVLTSLPQLWKRQAWISSGGEMGRTDLSELHRCWVWRKHASAVIEKPQWIYREAESKSWTHMDQLHISDDEFYWVLAALGSSEKSWHAEPTSRAWHGLLSYTDSFQSQAVQEALVKPRAESKIPMYNGADLS